MLNSTNKKTHEKFVNELKHIFDDEYTPLEEYIDAKTKILMKHNICGYKWKVRPNSMTGKQKTGCPKCGDKKTSEKRRRSHEEFNALIQARYNNEYTLLSEYETKRKKIKVRHDICGYQWETSAENLTKAGVITPCKKCRIENSRLDKEDVLKEIYKKVQGEYTLIGEYTGMSKKIKMRHNKCGHIWDVRLDNFLRNDSRCPKCAIGQSVPEQIIYFYIKQIYPDTISKHRPSWLGKQEIDIFIPSINVGIEYDGGFFHNSLASFRRDMKKSDKIKKHQIKLIRVRENGCYPLDNTCNDIVLEYNPKNKNYSDIDIVIKSILSSICYENLSIDNLSIDIEKDFLTILEFCKSDKEENILESKFHHIAKEWHPTKNGILTPKHFSSGSDYKVWWLGKCGHEWEALIRNRTTKNSGCPICANMQVLKGYNDLATLKPELAKEWHPTKNGNLKPNEFNPYTPKKVWWLGKCSHEWEAPISARNKGTGCPYCTTRKVLIGFNDLCTKNSKLAKEWHPTKNGNLKPNQVSSNSSEKVWWLGRCGHEWEATVSSRNNNGTGCPYCSNQKILIGFNDLCTKNSELAKEWHPTKNGNLKPSEVTENSHRKVWWLGKCGHEWETSILGRNSGNGCPECLKEERNNKWNENFLKLEECFYKYGDCTNFKELNTNGLLSKWASYQRKVYKQGKLDTWKINKLNQINFKWELDASKK